MPLDRRATSQQPPERQLLRFGVGAVVYALPIERIRAVVNPQEIVELPHAPHAVLGVTDHRGEVVPVIDLRARFGLVPIDDPDVLRRTKWIMLDVSDDGAPRLVAAIVDVVHNVFTTREPLRAAPTLGGGVDARGIAGVIARTPGAADQQLVFVLDLGPLRALAEAGYP